MNWILIKLISGYQKWISPYKGFRCSYAYKYGGYSCSQAIKEIIKNKGLVRGWFAIKEQFAKCHSSYDSIKKEEDDENPVQREKKRDCTPLDICSCIPFDF